MTHKLRYDSNKGRLVLDTFDIGRNGKMWFVFKNLVNQVRTVFPRPDFNEYPRPILVYLIDQAGEIDGVTKGVRNAMSNRLAPDRDRLVAGGRIELDPWLLVDGERVEIDQTIVLQTCRISMQRQT